MLNCCQAAPLDERPIGVSSGTAGVCKAMAGTAGVSKAVAAAGVSGIRGEAHSEPMKKDSVGEVAACGVRAAAGDHPGLAAGGGGMLGTSGS